MISRRAFMESIGLALAGLALPAPLAPRLLPMPEEIVPLPEAPTYADILELEQMIRDDIAKQIGIAMDEACINGVTFQQSVGYREYATEKFNDGGGYLES